MDNRSSCVKDKSAFVMNEVRWYRVNNVLSCKGRFF